MLLSTIVKLTVCPKSVRANVFGRLVTNEPCTLLRCHSDPFPLLNLLICFLLPALPAALLPVPFLDLPCAAQMLFMAHM